MGPKEDLMRCRIASCFNFHQFPTQKQRPKGTVPHTCRQKQPKQRLSFFSSNAFFVPPTYTHSGKREKCQKWKKNHLFVCFAWPYRQQQAPSPTKQVLPLRVSFFSSYCGSTVQYSSAVTTNGIRSYFWWRLFFLLLPFTDALLGAIVRESQLPFPSSLSRKKRNTRLPKWDIMAWPQ